MQDDETQFQATSAQSIWAAETYRMGYRGIAYTPWMAGLLARDYGMEARWFECGTDLETYPFGDEPREPGLLAVYARRETERRAVDLAMAGIATLFERRPGVRVTLFGSNAKQNSPVPATNLGVRPPADLAALYRRASAGVVFSLTTHSLVAQEMMASGLPLVELNGDNVASALGRSGERAMLADPRPDAIADALAGGARRPDEAAAMAQPRAVSSKASPGSARATRSKRRCGRSWPSRRAGRSSAGAPAQPPAAEAGEQEHDGAARDGQGGRRAVVGGCGLRGELRVADLRRRRNCSDGAGLVIVVSVDGTEVVVVDDLDL